MISLTIQRQHLNPDLAPVHVTIRLDTARPMCYAFSDDTRRD